MNYLKNKEKMAFHARVLVEVAEFSQVGVWIQKIQNRPDCGRLCVVQTEKGTWLIGLLANEYCVHVQSKEKLHEKALFIK